MNEALLDSSVRQSALLSINELVERGDHSLRYSVQTERPQNYFVPAATASARDFELPLPALHEQFLKPRTVIPPGRSLTALRDCYVLPNAAIVTSEGQIIKESCFPYTRRWIPQFFGPWIAQEGTSLEVRLGDEPEIIERPTVYVREHGERGFFHWMHSVLPRADVFKTHKLTKEFALLYDTEMPFQRDGLALYDLPGVSILNPNRERPQFFRELLFPSTLVEDGDFWLRPPSVAAFYESLPVPVTDRPKRIYITRRDAEFRRLRNEAQVEEQLHALGFVSLELSTYSFPEQLGLLRSCEFVVAVHGAGLSHLVSMPVGAGVLEILHPRRFWPTYRAMSARRGLRYALVVGEDEQAEGDTFDFDVDIKKMLGVMRAMGAA